MIYLFTNELRLILGLCFAAGLMDFIWERKILLLTALGGCLVTALQTAVPPVAALPAASLPTAAVVGAGAELLILAAAIWYHLREKPNICLFLAFFYEAAVGLWDFLLPSALGVLFRSERFPAAGSPEHLTAVCLVRLLMLAAVFLVWKSHNRSENVIRITSIASPLGLLGAVALSEQTVLPLDEEQVSSWIILSVILLFSVMFYRLNRQREMEAEIARLRQSQTEILERDYQALSRTYADNARLYHDLHNHIEAIYQCLARGNFEEALEYCGDLRAPVGEITQTVWTGDKAVDYLIGSKMALAMQEQIRTDVTIEYPRSTNIRSADLTAILGNLLDNALEAARSAPKPLKFLRLTIRRINDMLIIKVENGYENTPTAENGELQTSKEDRALHGWGLKSAQAAAGRYDGTVRAEYADGIFRAVAVLSFEPVEMNNPVGNREA